MQIPRCGACGMTGTIQQVGGVVKCTSCEHVLSMRCSKCAGGVVGIIEGSGREVVKCEVCGTVVVEGFHRAFDSLSCPRCVRGGKIVGVPQSDGSGIFVMCEVCGTIVAAYGGTRLGPEVEQRSRDQYKDGR